MPKTSEMRVSKFLKQDDVGRGVLVTIANVKQHDVAREDAGEPEMRWCLHFKELDKPLVLNATNIASTEKVCGSDNTDDWIGKRLVLYTDPNVMYKGKMTGGVRIRAPKPTAPPAPPPPVQELTDDDIPF